MTKMTAPFGRYADPASSHDPDVQALLQRLGDLPPGPRMSPEFRRDLRVQLVAIAPRVIGSGSTEDLPELDASPRLIRVLASANRPVRVEDAPATARRRGPRLYQVALAATTMMVAVFATLVGLSQNSLPGDALYGLKRSGESVRMTFTRGDESKGRLNLKYASADRKSVV